MSIKTFVIGSLSVAAITLAACSKPAEREFSTVSGSAILNSNATPAEKAEALAKQAEELLTAQGFLEAAKMDEAALKEDPTNFRARLIKAVLGPVLEAKGIYTNLRPLADSNPVTKENLDNEITRIQTRMPKSNFRDFLFDGNADIKTDAQLQARIDGFNKKVSELKQFLKKSHKSEITVKANTLLIPNLNKRFAQACILKETADLSYELSCPPVEKRFDVTLNEADFFQLADLLSLHQLTFSMMTAYDFTSWIAVVKKAAPNEDNTKQTYEEAIKNPQFGKLRSKAALTNMKEAFKDYADSFRYSIQNYTKLCPTGSDNGRNRPGMLFNEGVCYGPMFQPYVDILDGALQGKPYKMTAGKPQQSIEILPLALLDNPVQDLRSLGLTFNKCGSVENATDNKLGGIFPNSDANVLLNVNKETCK